MALYLHTSSDGLNTEGIGAVAQASILLHAICKKFDVGFYHTGFKDIGHSTYTNFTREEWSNSFTEFFNFSTSKEIKNKVSLSFSQIDEEFISFIEKNKNTDQDIFVFINSQSVLEYGQSIINEIYTKEYLKTLKNNFIFKNNYFQKEYLNISFHIRSINPEDTALVEIRELYYNDYTNYIHLIHELQKVCEDEKVKLHIHSQGEYKNFKEILNEQKNNFEIVLHLNDHPISDIYHMSYADLLIMANSSFSWIAHLLNYNTTLVRDNFWHLVYPNTIRLDQNYSFHNKLRLK